jgi:hypothetical protein
VKDRDVIFHKKWLGLAQPSEGLVFSVPALADAQIAPEERPELSTAFAAQLEDETPRIRSLGPFFRDFLGYAAPGMLVPRAELPAELSFYAAEGGRRSGRASPLGAALSSPTTRSPRSTRRQSLRGPPHRRMHPPRSPGSRSCGTSPRPAPTWTWTSRRA